MIVLLAGLGAVAVATAGWRITSASGPLPARLVESLLPLLTLAAFLMALGRIAAPGALEWNGGKLAPVVAMTKGYALYQDPNHGVMTGWLYGPVGALLLLPAAVAKDPTTARMIGIALSSLWFFVPAILLLRLAQQTSSAADARRRGQSTLVWAASLVFIWATVYFEDLDRIVFIASPDAPAIGLAALACATIYFRRTLTTMSLSCLAAVLCVWTKQNFLPLLAGLILWVAVVEHLKAALTYLGLIAGIGACVSAVLLLSFGPRDMYFHMVTLPMSHPLREASRGAAVAWGSALLDLIAWSSWPLVIIMSVSCAQTFFCAPTNSSVQLRSRLRQWLQSRPWSLLLAAALFTIPSSLIGYAKAGGNVNNLGCTTYFLWLAALAAVIAVAQLIPSSNAPMGLSHALTLLCVGLAVNAIQNTRNGLLSEWPTIVHPYANPEQAAFAYAIDHPQQVYCPSDPLVTLLSENKLYNFEWGLIDRIYANRHSELEGYQSHLPEKMNKIIFATEPQSNATLLTLPRYNHRTSLPELPGCVVFTE